MDAPGLRRLPATSRGGGGGGYPYNGLCREAPAEMGTFFWLQVYERVGILIVEVYVTASLKTIRTL